VVHVYIILFVDPATKQSKSGFVNL